ncbi:hypothetical protein BST81_11785 [Leptolyngbya sp. 'hensonii']|uniref:AMIN domain-containing protein n=1 Tax=Leptolyngbya sp. 'hensonii' TaxID=1922337 RepID=UPI00094FF39E|nr:AMIN domain-containing protein [Leptolyngbya sp. 'hensonii']OLP18232.1 hypothetical protein BST81_11785 [Leptolyngbya sp. 'hensonii']
MQNRDVGIWLGVASLGSIVAFSLPAQAALLTNWKFDQATSRLEFTLSDQAKPQYFLMAQPVRIVLDLPATKLGDVPTKQNFSGPVRQIRLSQSKQGQTRIVIELAPDVVLAAEQVKLQKVGQRWVVQPLIVASAPVSRPALPVTGTSSPTPAGNTALPPPPPGLSPATTATGQNPAISVPSLPTNSAPPVAPPPGLPSIGTVPQNNLPSANGALPPPIFMGNPNPTVAVPPLGQSSGSLPPVQPNSTGMTVSVPPLNQPSNRPATATSVRIPVIEFGQPLPKTSPGTKSQSTLPPLEPGAILLQVETPVPKN